MCYECLEDFEVNSVIVGVLVNQYLDSLFAWVDNVIQEFV